MNDITIIVVSAATIINSAAIGVLAVTLKRQDDELKLQKWRLESHYERIKAIKEGFKKLRAELINKKIIGEGFRYLNKDEEIEDILNRKERRSTQESEQTRREDW